MSERLLHHPETLMWAQARWKNLVKWIIGSKGRMGITEKSCKSTLLPRKGPSVRQKSLVRLFGSISRKTLSNLI